MCDVRGAKIGFYYLLNYDLIIWYFIKDIKIGDIIGWMINSVIFIKQKEFDWKWKNFFKIGGEATDGLVVKLCDLLNWFVRLSTMEQLHNVSKWS